MADLRAISRSLTSPAYWKQLFLLRRSVRVAYYNLMSGEMAIPRLAGLLQVGRKDGAGAESNAHLPFLSFLGESDPKEI
jgi:hypothetical protein